LQTELAEEKSHLFTHRSYRGEHNKSTSRKKKVKKIIALNVMKKCCMQVRNWLEIFWQTQDRAWSDPKSPARLI